MSTGEEKKSVGLSKEQYEVVTNQIAVALAKNESIVAGWIAKSSRAYERRKTDEELKAEDAVLFRPQPPRLGLGAPIPPEYLKNTSESSTKELRSRLMPSKILKASKARDAEEKAASAKRGLKDQSSDEEEGRSSLGRKKKQKVTPVVEVPVKKKVREGKHIDGEGRLASDIDLAKVKSSVELKQNKALLVQHGETKEDKRSKKQKKRDKKDHLVPGEHLRGTPEQLPILPRRPRVVEIPEATQDETEIVDEDTKMDGTEEAVGVDEQDRLRKKELKKEQKRQRKKEKKERKKAEREAAGLS